MKLKNVLLSLSAGIVLAAIPRIASAEWFVDAYAGPAITENGRFSGTKTDYDPGPSAGGRVGYYLGVFPFLGFAVDGSAFKQEGELGSFSRFDARGSSISFDAMVRLPLGPVQPYVLAGPGIYWTKVNTLGNNDRDSSLGVNAGGGVKWMFLPHFGLMTEYRFSHTRPEILGVHTTFRTHRVLAGISFHF
jgi:opacity protein-like surface antigen